MADELHSKLMLARALRRLASARGGTSTAVAAATMATSSRELVELIDVDANLTHDKLFFEAEKHIEIAQSQGVAGFVVPGTTLNLSLKARELSAKHPGVIYPTLGIHPYEAKNDCQSVHLLAQNLELPGEPKFCAVGECGLDFSDGFPSKDVQIPVFRAQVAMAVAHNMPLFLHERAAISEFLEILDEYKPMPERVLIHCFTGPLDDLRAYVKRGYFISISGMVCGSRGKPLRAAISAAKIPLSRIMIETDCPYMGFKNCRLPGYGDNRTSPNVPSALPLVLEQLSKCMGTSIEILAKKSTENARVFFGLHKQL